MPLHDHSHLSIQMFVLKWRLSICDIISSEVCIASADWPGKETMLPGHHHCETVYYFLRNPGFQLIFIWKAPGTYYNQESIEYHHYGGESLLIWGDIIIESRANLNVQSETMNG
ncbi:hypothetical protein NPIL_651581 [Nephila pilipes]|uniref:Uncharacterized protein n=1 Tax=Nephila pilipes TaxID=299642 RepID=A0A8X6IP00_NEPPI|nr:hypothetical protein NPIL_651581 [Nephila pilipes]